MTIPAIAKATTALIGNLNSENGPIDGIIGQIAVRMRIVQKAMMTLSPNSCQLTITIPKR